MTMATPSSKPFEIRGWHVLTACLAFFGAVFLVNGVMIYAALNSFPGVETVSSYQAGRLYPREIERARRQAERQWQAGAHMTRAADGMVSAQVTFADNAGRAISGLNVQVRFIHPAAAGYDALARLDETAPGTYRGKLGPLATGQWEVSIEALEKDELVFRSLNRTNLR